MTNSIPGSPPAHAIFAAFGAACRKRRAERLVHMAANAAAAAVTHVA